MAKTPWPTGLHVRRCDLLYNIFLWPKEHTLIVLLTIVTLFDVFWLYKMRARLRMKWYAIVIVSVLHTVIGVGSVKAFAFLESGDIGNMSLFGGIFFMPVAYYTSARG